MKNTQHQGKQYNVMVHIKNITEHQQNVIRSTQNIIEHLLNVFECRQNVMEHQYNGMKQPKTLWHTTLTDLQKFNLFFGSFGKK